MKWLVDYITKSTLKREFAGGVFSAWFSIDGYLTIRLPITQIVPDAAIIQWQSLGPYMFALVTAAFGADWVSKQTNIAGPPTNTQTTVAATVTDDTTTVTTTSEPKT